jgi:hypothetical protein
MHPAQQKIIKSLENAISAQQVLDDGLESWALETVIKRLIAGNQETIKMLAGKEFLARDQYGQIGKAYLAVNLNRQIVITTEGD